MRDPCPLPLVALRGDETCPRCGRPAREHRGHPAYVEPAVIVGVDFATEPDQTVRQYFFLSDNCPVNDATDPRCICWRDEGTGPLKDYPGRVTWRTVRKPQPQEKTMTETTEPTREQIERIAAMPAAATLAMGRERIDLRDVAAMALRTLDSETIACSCKPKRYRPRWVQFDTPTREQIEAWASDIEHADWREDATIDQQEHVLRMALRTLDAEAKLAERDRYIAEQRAITEPSVQDLARQLREATERAEKAERECAEAWDVHGMAVARAEKDEAQLAAMHRRAQRAESATADARREAIGQRKRADWWRSEAKRLGWTPDYPELRKDPPSDARIDCESSSLLLLSTWARRVMMREKNRDKGVPTQNILDLLGMARHELSEARWAIAGDAPIDDVLAELGDAAAIIGFAMRDVESRRKA